MAGTFSTFSAVSYTHLDVYKRQALYCPTGYLELLRLQDRFVYLPEMPYRKVALDQAARNVLSQERFAQDGGCLLYTSRCG